MYVLKCRAGKGELKNEKQLQKRKKTKALIHFKIIEQNLKMAVLHCTIYICTYVYIYIYSETKLKGILGKTFLLNDLLALGSWARQVPGPSKENTHLR